MPKSRNDLLQAVHEDGLYEVNSNNVFNIVTVGCHKGYEIGVTIFSAISRLNTGEQILTFQV